ncbi:glutamic acid-rich protein-like isoform X2 [Nymphalis io]|uniref:glutamic acid-rich protein-like isoform X2 n=1 Tax=Inachis io TaxID=171585 RepID=UPI002167E443|nr:glutamic acid-rich protein-like isoform X2 [Nymphalis io]
MSLKNSKPEKKKPRAMPVETIVTRFKSAQQKRLLEKEQAKPTKKSKNINSSRKSQPVIKKTEKKSPRHKKVKKSDKNVNEKKIEDTQVENKEYYPTKLKRKVLNARRFLAPKPNCKVICTTKSVNKRKLHVPQRDMKYVVEQMQKEYAINSVKSLKQKTQSPELSITEMVRIIEENGSLDDEDLLEILTCPSPVWWEEPPDGYIEEALFSQDRPADNISVKNQIKEEEKKDIERKRYQEDKHEMNSNDNQTNIPETLDINIESRDKMFINKRCKLETLLGIIKNKGLKPNIHEIKSNKNESDSTNVIKNDRSNDKPKEAVELEDVKEIIEEANDKNHPEYADEGLIDLRDADGKNISNEVKHKMNSECADADLIDFEDEKVKDISKEVKDKRQSDCMDKDLIHFRDSEVKDIIDEVKDKTNSECADADLIDFEDEEVKDIRKEVKDISDEKDKINSECTDEDLIHFEEEEVNEICKELKDKMHSEFADEDLIEFDEDEEVNDISNDVKDKTNSECADEDLNEFRDDEILRHLENLEIPIEKTIKVTNLVESKDVDDDLTRRVSIESNISDKNMSEEYLDMSLLDDDHDDKLETDDDNDKREIFDDDNDERVMSNDNTINSEPSQLNELKLDEQHDDLNKTNGKHDIDNEETVKKIKLDKVNADKNKKKSDHRKDYELVTVYKIINSATLLKEMDETSKKTNENIDKVKDIDKTDGRINSYYKHCKRVPTLKLKLVKELTKEKRDYKCKEKFHRANRAITISESDNVKYCFVCSSIFDSEKCNYCLRKTLKRKLNEYYCDVCGLNVNTKKEMIEHLNVHESVE